jgi:hypothetical protein
LTTTALLIEEDRLIAEATGIHLLRMPRCRLRPGGARWRRHLS